MSDANRVNLAYKLEATYKTDPGGNYDLFPMTREGLEMVHNTTRSELLNSDRQISDFVQIDDSTQGDIESELLIGTHDTFYRATLCAAAGFAAVPAAVASLTVDVAISGSGSAAQTLFTRSAGTWVTTPVPGQWIHWAGFANALNNGYWMVKSATTATITCAGTGANVTAAPTITFQASAVLVNGTTLNSLYMQRQYLDLTTTNIDFPGMVVDSAQITAAANRINQVRFSFRGSNGIYTATAKTVNAAPAASPTNAVRHVAAATVGGTRLKQDIQSLQVTLGNNVGPRSAIGTLGPTSYRLGSVSAEGRIQVYFSQALDLQDFTGDATSRFGFLVEDANDLGLGFGFPAAKIAGWSGPPPGLDQDVMENLTFQAFRNGTAGSTVVLSRF